MLFDALVTASDTATFNIEVSPNASTQLGILQGIPLASVMSSMLGFKESAIPPIGSSVLCYQVKPGLCYILGIIPDQNIGIYPMPSRTIIGAGDGNNDTQNVQGYNYRSTKIQSTNNNRPTDIVEGEYSIGNELGVLIGLFQELAVLKGSELAQVQCFLFDDLVRIISHNFEHWTSMGGLKVFHDGQGLNLEYGATHIPSEGLGVASVTSTPSTDKTPFSNTGTATVDDSKDFYAVKPNDQLQAIERLKVFVGRLGDFVRLSLVRPTPDQPRLFGVDPSSANKDLGLFDLHLGTDGKFHIRSIKEIFIEKLNWIKVPQRVRTPEDPQGNANVSYKEKALYEWDTTITYNENPLGYFLQLRDYAAYSQDLALTNFRKQDKDFNINDEKPDLTQIDKVDPLTPVNYRYALTKSGIYLMENGGMLFKDAFGSAIVMEGGNICHQPAKDLVLQPMRNLIGKVGQFTSIASRLDVDISSSEGGYRLKTKQAQYNYSSDSGIVLHSDSDSLSAGTPDTSAITDIGGIVLKAKTGVHRYADSAVDTINTSYKVNAGEIWQESVNLSRYISQQDLHLTAKQSVLGLAQGNIAMVAGRVALLAGDSTTTVGKKGQTLAVEPTDPNAPFNPPKGVVALTTYTDLATKDIADDITTGTPDFKPLQFKFLDSSAYHLTDSDCLFQTICQQENIVTDILNTVSWSENPVNNTYPYPGSDNFNGNFLVTCKLNNSTPASGGYDLDYKSGNDLISQSQLEKTSLQTYKVLTF